MSFDLDLSDDEYWNHPDPSQRFKQLPNKPSLITQFNKLNQVLALSLRAIASALKWPPALSFERPQYSINKSKIFLGFVGPQWEKPIVAELDSPLNKGVDSVPDHFRWGPNREYDNFFNQSVLLRVAYYLVQILVHRSGDNG
ncbi:hypothetical protein K443DRAFT_444762 [Laccaria amethystina LaAM-08-1]|uniref:Uncharacterized protein n=1 Tax=Laccaria amethystina LaAM-08-1 TaxID=1095629 RepID=A0A0C9WI19_9AGAR|nr:hypothetical protein K443DRAFT_444762 [Laccaria amethystina LaAM-08-1]